MDKKIGKIVFLFFLYCFSLGADEIILQALDMNGKSITQAVTNMPFILEVRVTSQNSIPGTPQVAGLEHVSVDDKGHVSTINSIINGVRSTKKIYQYHVLIDKPGIHTFGPALLVSNKRRLQSNILTLEVVNEQKVSKLSEPFISLSVDKKDAVIGEPINFKIRFYPVKSVNLEGMSEPSFKDFSATKLEGPYSGSEMIDGNVVNYIEWRNKIYPKKAGALKIPSVSAIYKMQRTFRSNALDIFDRLFDGGLDKKQIYSNALSIVVSELPAHDKAIDAIGRFASISAFVDHAQAHEGEGIVYSLVIEGEGDLQSIVAPALVMPEGLKFYESKSFIDQAKNRKTFEYIVQGIKPGSWSIPSQYFTYFDLTTRNIKTIESNPLEIEVLENGLREAEKQSQDAAKEEESAVQVLPLQQDGPWSEPKERSMSWVLFFIVCSLISFIPLYKFVHFLSTRYQAKNKIFALKKNAFKNAKKSLSYAHDVNDTQALYGIFILFFAHRLMISSEQVTAELIEQYLKQNSNFAEYKAQWQDFFNTISQQRFFERYPMKDQEQLFSQARQWLEILEKQ
jgi:hypothetical protein